ncbi:MAG TPA: protein-disulfide reductase DsbD domain-containing protein [Rhizomicrobium sp.]
MGRFLFAIFVALGMAAPAGAQIDSRPRVQAKLVAESGEIAPGGTVAVALEENIRPGWHTYWRNPGDAGAPSEIKWFLPPGWKAGAIQWPYPKDLPVGPLMDYGYEGKVWLLTELKAPSNAPVGATTIRAAVSWLVCQEVCIPEDATLALSLGVTASPLPPYAIVQSQFAAARARLPIAAPWPAIFSRHHGLELYVAAPGVGSPNTIARFFPFEQDVIKGIAPQEQGRAQNGLVLRLAPGKRSWTAPALSGVLELTAADGSTRAFAIDAKPGVVPPANFTQAPKSDLTLPLALLFAFLGGLILNLMPCVLPILAMKALAIASHAGKTGREASREGFAYGIGVVSSFAGLGGLVIALRAGGAAVGWGFQLQEPLVVAGCALLIFAVALNLSGVYEIPGVGVGHALARRGGLWGAFFTGVLAVAVAAPCTAPFMAAALGFALTQSDAVSLLVFIALGVGFAAPFVLLALWPSLLRLLPKPGAWMVTLRQLLAFPMYATALWLAWVLGVQSDPSRLVALLAVALTLAFGLWAFAASRNARGGTRAWGWLALVLSLLAIGKLALLLAGGPPAAASRSLSDIPSEPFTQARLESLRAQDRAVFVNATAAWCVTCMVNERVAFDDSRVRRAFAARRVTYLVADWTRRNAQVTALLNAFGRDGVPLYVYYAPGAADGRVLPQILTPDEVLKALRGG